MLDALGLRYWNGLDQFRFISVFDWCDIHEFWIKQGFVMNMQPSEAEAGFDIRFSPTTDPDLLKKKIADEWAPASRNMSFEVSNCPSALSLPFTANI